MLCGFLCLFKGISDFRRNDGFADLLAHLLEQLAVFRTFNGFTRCAKQLCAALLENAFLVQLNRQVQTGLSADARNDRVRSFIAENFGDVFEGQRFHVNLVRHLGVCHDCGRVGIAENYLIAFLSQRDACLCAGIVKFRCLTDNDRA